MATRFGHDLSHVRVHADEQARASATKLGTAAYTLGNHVVLADPQHAGVATLDNRVLAHELAHVLQQRPNGASQAGLDVSAVLSGDVPVGARTDPAEAEADTLAAIAMSAGHAGRVAVRRADANPIIRRAPEHTEKDPDSAENLPGHASVLKNARTFRYGCWCGSGHRKECTTLEQSIDDIDKCCYYHDKAYDAVHVTSKLIRGRDEIGMWSREGLIKTLPIDRDILTCMAKTKTDGKKYGRDADLIRGEAAIMFGTRIAIASTMNLPHRITTHR